MSADTRCSTTSEFLESRYAERESPSASTFTRFTEAIEDKLRAGKVSASAIAETVGFMNRAANVLNNARRDGQEHGERVGEHGAYLDDYAAAARTAAIDARRAHRRRHTKRRIQADRERSSDGDTCASSIEPSCARRTTVPPSARRAPEPSEQ